MTEGPTEEAQDHQNAHPSTTDADPDKKWETDWPWDNEE